ncbi:uncharacterized protein LOC135492883 [Lineus longissimus]|uniref:uncharacterized protein LOC135492883 n=1 Tax=Lineus longissimus TaxID=88925 RepID=UPI002B4C581C
MTTDAAKPVTAVTSVLSYSFAATKLNDPHSCFCEVTTTKSLALLPRFLSNIKNGITDQLDRELNIYSEKLNGVLIAYKNIRLKNYSGTVIGDDPLIYVDIVADLMVFKPELGCTLEGVVNKIGRDHIGYLVHGCFNASTDKPTNSKNDVLKVGDAVLLDVALLLPVNGVLTICATINEESLEGLKANISGKKKKKQSMPVQMEFTIDGKKKNSDSGGSGVDIECTSSKQQSRLDLWMTPKKRKAGDDYETAEDGHPAKKTKMLFPERQTKVASPVNDEVVDIDAESEGFVGVEADDSGLNDTLGTQLVQKSDEKKRLKQERKARKRELKEARRRGLNETKTKLESVSEIETAESDSYVTADSHVIHTPDEVESEKKRLKQERKEKKRREKSKVANVDVEAVSGIEGIESDLYETADSLVIETRDEASVEKQRLKQEKKARKKKSDQRIPKVLDIDTENVSTLVIPTAHDAMSEKRRLKQERKAKRKELKREKKKAAKKELKKAEEEIGARIVSSFAESEKLIPKSVSAKVSKTGKAAAEKKTICDISDSDSSSDDFVFVGSPLLKTDNLKRKPLPGVSTPLSARVTGSSTLKQPPSSSVVPAGVGAVSKSRKEHKKDKNESALSPSSGGSEHKKKRDKNKSAGLMVNSPLAFTEIKDKKGKKNKIGDSVLNVSDLPHLTLTGKKHKKNRKESVGDASAGNYLNDSGELGSKDSLLDSPVVGSKKKPKKKKFELGASPSPMPIHDLESTMIHPSIGQHRKSDLFISPIVSESLSTSPPSGKKLKTQKAVIESPSHVHSKVRKRADIEILKNSMTVASTCQVDVSQHDDLSDGKKKHKKKKKSNDKDRSSLVDLNMTGVSVLDSGLKKKKYTKSSAASCDSDASKFLESKTGTIFDYFAPCPMGEKLPRKRNDSTVSMQSELEVSTEIKKKKKKKSKEKDSDRVVDAAQTIKVSSKKRTRDASPSGTDLERPTKKSKKSKDLLKISDPRQSLQNEFLEKASKSSKKKHSNDDDDSGVNSLASSMLSISNQGVGVTGASVDAGLVSSSLKFEVSKKKKKKKRKKKRDGEVQ